MNTSVLTNEKRQELAHYIHWHLGGDQGYTITLADVYNELTEDILYELLTPIGEEIYAELQTLQKK